MKKKPHPEQINFFEEKRELEKRPYEPGEEDRERLVEFYGPEAAEAPLTKGEAIGKSRKKKEKIGRVITRGRQKIGIHRKGDQEEISI